MKMQISSSITLKHATIHLYNDGAQDYAELDARIHPIGIFGPDNPKLALRFTLPPDIEKYFREFLEKNVGLLLEKRDRELNETL